MPLSVRLPQGIEQRLAEYSVRSGQSRTEVVVQAIDAFLEQPRSASPYERLVAAGVIDPSNAPVAQRTPAATNAAVRAAFRRAREMPVKPKRRRG